MEKQLGPWEHQTDPLKIEEKKEQQDSKKVSKYANMYFPTLREVKRKIQNQRQVKKDLSFDSRIPLLSRVSFCLIEKQNTKLTRFGSLMGKGLQREKKKKFLPKQFYLELQNYKRRYEQKKMPPIFTLVKQKNKHKVGVSQFNLFA